MYKAKYSDIKWLLNNDCSKEVKEVFKGIQPIGHEVAWYGASGNNWAYHILITGLNGRFYEVVTVFGEVKGGRELMLDNYNKWNTEKAVR